MSEQHENKPKIVTLEENSDDEDDLKEVNPVLKEVIEEVKKEIEIPKKKAKTKKYSTSS